MDNRWSSSENPERFILLVLSNLASKESKDEFDVKDDSSGRYPPVVKPKKHSVHFFRSGT